jgi:anti-sigma B factor antagonist
MTEGSLITDVRELSSRASVIDLKGDVTASSEKTLADAYTRASGKFTRTIVLNFSRLVAFGLNEHYRQIFELTRLDEAIGIYDSEAEAFADADAP